MKDPDELLNDDPFASISKGGFYDSDIDPYEFSDTLVKTRQTNMYTPLDTIILNKPIEEATYLDWCKGTPRQRLLKEMKEAPLEVVKARTGDLAEMAFEAMKTCKEGYMRIQRQWPSPDEPHEGWTYVFAAGLPLYLDKPEEWYYTSNIEKIDWEGKTFVTQNSVYSFEFLDTAQFDKKPGKDLEDTEEYIAEMKAGRKNKDTLVW